MNFKSLNINSIASPQQIAKLPNSAAFKKYEAFQSKLDGVKEEAMKKLGIDKLEEKVKSLIPEEEIKEKAMSKIPMDKIQNEAKQIIEENGLKDKALNYADKLGLSATIGTVKDSLNTGVEIPDYSSQFESLPTDITSQLEKSGADTSQFQIDASAFKIDESAMKFDIGSLIPGWSLVK